MDWAVVWKIAQEEPSLLERQVLVIIRAEFPALAESYELGPYRIQIRSLDAITVAKAHGRRATLHGEF